MRFSRLFQGLLSLAVFSVTMGSAHASASSPIYRCAAFGEKSNFEWVRTEFPTTGTAEEKLIQLEIHGDNYFVGVSIRGEGNAQTNTITAYRRKAVKTGPIVLEAIATETTHGQGEGVSVVATDGEVKVAASCFAQ